MKDLHEKSAQIVHDEKRNTLDAKLSGFIKFDDLKRYLHYEFDMIRHYKLTNCLVDLRDMGVYPQGGKEFVEQVWFPEVKKLGVTKVAFIVPESVFGEASMKAAHEKEEKKEDLQIQNFMNRESAQKWLTEDLKDLV